MCFCVEGGGGMYVCACIVGECMYLCMYVCMYVYASLRGGVFVELQPET